MNNIIIIGGGIAAISAVKSIREINPGVAIDLFSEEKFYPYYRLRLSKNLLDKFDENNLLLQKKDWYENNRVNLHLNVRVQGVDVERQQITLPQAKRMSYDRLLLANGASNRPLTINDADAEIVNTIRNLDDVQKIQGRLQEEQAILYIGGGVLGLETAWILEQHHKKAIITEIQNRLFPKQLDERAATILTNRVESFGIRVLTHAEVVKIPRDGAGVELKDGRKFSCDMVLYSIGIQPNIDILKGTPIKTQQGVIVNEKMETNIPNVYAAGDVAEYEGKAYGLWNVAMGQGKTAGYNMAGKTTIYQPLIPVTALNAYGISLFSMGDVSESGTTQTITEEDSAKNIYRRIFIRDQIIVGAILIGDTSKSPQLKTAIERRLPLAGIDFKEISVVEILEQLRKTINEG